MIDREQEKCAREMELMWIEDVSERRRLRGGREAAVMPSASNSRFARC